MLGLSALLDETIASGARFILRHVGHKVRLIPPSSAVMHELPEGFVTPPTWMYPSRDYHPPYFEVYGDNGDGAA